MVALKFSDRLLPICFWKWYYFVTALAEWVAMFA